MSEGTTFYAAGMPIADPNIAGTALAHMAANPAVVGAVAGAATFGAATIGLALLSSVKSILQSWFGSPEPGNRF